MFNYNIVDIHFLATALTVTMYVVLALLMFLAVPHHPQYMFSLISAERSTSLEYFAFALLGWYSKTGIACMKAFDGITIFPGILSATFYLQHIRLVYNI